MTSSGGGGGAYNIKAMQWHVLWLTFHGILDIEKRRRSKKTKHSIKLILLHKNEKKKNNNKLGVYASAKHDSGHSSLNWTQRSSQWHQTPNITSRIE